MAPYKTPYSPGFEPVMREGQVAKIVLLDRYVYAKVLTPPEPVIIPPVIVAVTNVATGVTLDTKDYLALRDDEVGQFRLFSSHPLLYKLNQPPATARYGTEKQEGWAYTGAPSHLQEVYVYRDIAPKLQIVPAHGLPITASIAFMGYKWKVEVLDREPEKYDVVIPVAYAAPRPSPTPVRRLPPMPVRTM